MNIGPVKFHESYKPEPTPTPEQIKKLKEGLAAARFELSRTRSELRKLCEDFGNPDWDDYTPLDAVVKHHLSWHLYNDYEMAGAHKCALCNELSPDVTFGKSELVEERTGNEGEVWVCKACLDKARAEWESQISDY